MKDKIEIIYDLIIRGIKINKELLNIYNFSDDEINKYIEGGVLINDKNDMYKIASVNNLYRYGIKLLLLGKIKRSKDCFTICYRMDPNNREICIQLMNIALKEKNYIGVSKMFDIIKQISPENYIEDNKLYAYLLGIIMEQNSEYSEILKNTEPDELQISKNNDYPDRIKQNIIRRYITNQRYKMALRSINDLIRENRVYNTELELLKELISQTLKKDEKYKNNIKIAIKTQDYEQVLKLLAIKSQNQYLNNKEVYIQQVTKTLIDIYKTNEIPVITEHNTKFLYDAIKGNNFKLAKVINDQFLEETNQDIKEDSLHILLDDIISLIQSIEEELIKEVNPSYENNPSNSFVEDTLSDIDLSTEEELALYILNKNITIEQAKKAIGILPEQFILIKLIFARYYYNEGTEQSIIKADLLIDEVENSHISSYKIDKYLNLLKNNRNNYIYSPITLNIKRKI